MEEKIVMEMYGNMFDNFQEQTRLFMTAVVEKQRNDETISIEILDNFKRNLINMLNTLGKSIENFKNEDFKNFYKSKIEYSYQYIEDLSSGYKNTPPKKI